MVKNSNNESRDISSLGLLHDATGRLFLVIAFGFDRFIGLNESYMPSSFDTPLFLSIVKH